jgi:DNA polymerase
MKTLEQLIEAYTDRVRNELKSDSRVVFGDGNVNANIVLIGEAPGEKEEQTGKPFVGAAGKNLDEFLDILKLDREDLYITNVVKIRPYKINPETGRKSNRPPNKKEIDISVDILDEQMKIIGPKIVVTLGNIPLKAMVKDNDAKIGDYHGKAVDSEEYVVFPLYHPASIIYNRSLYDVYISDLHKLKEYLDEHGIGGA